MSDSLVQKIDSMGTRIGDIEKSIVGLINDTELEDDNEDEEG